MKKIVFMITLFVVSLSIKGLQAGPLTPMGDEWPLAVNADSFQPIESHQSSQNVIAHCMHAPWVWNFQFNRWYHHHIVSQVYWNGCGWVTGYQHVYVPTYFVGRPSYMWQCSCGAAHF